MLANLVLIKREEGGRNLLDTGFTNMLYESIVLELLPQYEVFVVLLCLALRKPKIIHSKTFNSKSGVDTKNIPSASALLVHLYLLLVLNLCYSFYSNRNSG